MYEIVGSTEVTIPGLRKPLSPPKRSLDGMASMRMPPEKLNLLDIIYAASHHILIRYTHRTCEIFLVGS